MKILYTFLLFLMNCVLSVAQPEIIVPKPHQLKWHEAEMGAVFHYDLHVFDGIRYGQGNNRISPIEDYNIFNPTQLDTDQWIQAAKAAGCKFAVLKDAVPVRNSMDHLVIHRHADGSWISIIIKERWDAPITPYDFLSQLIYIHGTHSRMQGLC